MTSDEKPLPSPAFEKVAPRSSPTTTASPIATASPTSKPDFIFPSVTILEKGDVGGLSVLGFLINNTTEAVTQVKIRITLHISSEVTPIWKGIDLPYKHVRPSEKVPFLIHFPDTLLPESVVLEVINFQISGYEDAQLEVQFTGRTFTPEGEHLLLGWITNPDNHPTQIHHFHLLVGYSADEPAAMVAASIYPSSILPHQRAPFLIKLDEDQEQETGSFYPFLDATALSDLVEPSFSFPQYPEAILDPQGNLLIRGIIQNPDKISRWASASVVLLYQDQILSLALLNPPSPLGPGESRAFGLTDFPGWKTRLDELNGQLEDFYVEVFYDPLGCLEFKGQILPLAIEVTGFESTGSTLFIKGITTNPSSHLLSLPAIRAEIRTTNGKLQTSNWTILDETLAQGQSKDFLLAIRLPKGLKLSEMEIDLTGTAILEKSDLPF